MRAVSRVAAPIPLADVRLPPEAVAAATSVLEGGWLSSGRKVEEFEGLFAAYVGARHAIACSSGTGALQLAFAALGLRPGDEVVLPSLTFVAVANAAIAAGAVPVLADVVGADDLTLDPDSVARLIGPRTRVVSTMDYGGRPCSPEVCDVARSEGVAVVEDAAHAPGARLADGRRCGTLGDLSCFSFFANKNLALGEGGMVTTDEEQLARAVRRLRSHGQTSTTWERHTGKATTYDIERTGFNFRFDELRAAMGSVLVPGLDDAIERRGRAVERYRQGVAALERVELPFSGRDPGERPAHHLAAVVLDPEVDRDRVAGHLRARGIQTSVHYVPIHRMSAHRDRAADVSITDDLAERLLTLPLYPHLEPEQVDTVLDALGDALSTS